MTQQTTLQKIRFENGLAVAKSKIEYVMCRIEEIRLQLQGNPGDRIGEAAIGTSTGSIRTFWIIRIIRSNSSLCYYKMRVASLDP